MISTLERARATAEAISRETGLSPIGLDDLREMNCGRSEGMSFLKVRDDDAELYRGSARAFAQDNAAINVFTRRGSRFVLKLWNDTTHYAEGKS